MKIIIKNIDGIIEKEIPADINKTLLKQVEESGVEMQSACHSGICGACICTIEQWWENIDKSFRWEPWFPLGDDEVMTCIAGLATTDGENIILRKIY